MSNTHMTSGEPLPLKKVNHRIVTRATKVERFHNGLEIFFLWVYPGIVALITLAILNPRPLPLWQRILGVLTGIISYGLMALAQRIFWKAVDVHRNH